MDLLFFTHLLNGLLMIAMPMALGFYLNHLWKLGWRLWGIGAAAFIISQIGHIPFNYFLTWLFQQGYLPQPPVSWWSFFNPIVLGLSAGLFEEITRYVIFRWWTKDARSWRKGLLLGAGHGGIEAIIVGGLTLYGFLRLVNLRYVDLTPLFPASQLALAQQQVQAYWSMSWSYSLLGAVERLFTIPCHLAFAVLVMRSITHRQPVWLVLAILWHAIVDASSVYLSGLWSSYPWGAYAVEGAIGIAALISIAIIFSLRQPEPAAAEPAPFSSAAYEPLTLAKVEETKEDLDKSRFI
jgi:uncharacterized membrane protein YhfC